MVLVGLSFPQQVTVQTHDVDTMSPSTQFLLHELVHTQDVINAWKEDQDVSRVILNRYADELSAKYEDLIRFARSNNAAFQRKHSLCEGQEVCPRKHYVHQVLV